MQTSEVLNKAADLIEERGWDQGDGWVYPEKFHSRLCLEGALQAVMGIDGVGTLERARLKACPAYTAVSRYVGCSLLFGWNDARGRTASEVIEVLRAAALVEAAREQDREPVEVSA